MSRKFDNREFNKLLKEQFEKEAGIMEEAFFSDADNADAEDFQISQEEVNASYNKLIEKLKADGVYREEGASGEKREEEEKAGEKIVPMPEARRKDGGVHKSYRAAKAACWIVVCVLGVFAASMTSQGNREYFVERIRYWTGNDTKITIDTDATNDVADMSEFEAKDEIENLLGIEIPEFMYRPQGFMYMSYEIDPKDFYAFMVYQYEEAFITLYVEKDNEDKASRNISLHGKKVATISIEDDTLQINVMQIQDKKDVKPNYLAQWQMEQMFYELSGKMEEAEFIKIIENIKY